MSFIYEGLGGLGVDVLAENLGMASAFFATLADIESSKLIPSTWPDPTMFAPTSIVDPSAPAILWSYTVIKALGVAHCDVNTKTVDEVIQRSRIHVEPIIALSINAQESSREWKHRIEIVDEREKAPELEASGDNVSSLLNQALEGILLIM